eukprot:8663443-Pyramimonas_sp.AAC.1
MNVNCCVWEPVSARVLAKLSAAQSSAYRAALGLPLSNSAEQHHPQQDILRRTGLNRGVC